jgi:ubiquitin C-terminal hydrolase
MHCGCLLACQTQARKCLDLWSVPKVLVVHIKRFEYTAEHRGKIRTNVRFPLQGLDLSKHIRGPKGGTDAVYDLFAVANHMGGTGSGHYTAFTKNLAVRSSPQSNTSSWSRSDFHATAAAATAATAVVVFHFVVAALRSVYVPWLRWFRARQTEKWYHFDDAIVTEVDPAASISGSDAYVLFYASRS